MSLAAVTPQPKTTYGDQKPFSVTTNQQMAGSYQLSSATEPAYRPPSTYQGPAYQGPNFAQQSESYHPAPQSSTTTTQQANTPYPTTTTSMPPGVYQTSYQSTTAPAGVYQAAPPGVYQSTTTPVYQSTTTPAYQSTPGIYQSTAPPMLPSTGMYQSTAASPGIFQSLTPLAASTPLGGRLQSSPLPGQPSVATASVGKIVPTEQPYAFTTVTYAKQPNTSPTVHDEFKKHYLKHSKEAMADVQNRHKPPRKQPGCCDAMC